MLNPTLPPDDSSGLSSDLDSTPQVNSVPALGSLDNSSMSNNVSLENVFVSIPLSTYFLLRKENKYHERDHLTVTEEWLKQQNIPTNLIHVERIEGEKFIRIYRIEDWERSNNTKDKAKEEKQAKLTEEQEKLKAYHAELEQWKKTALTRLMAKCRLDKTKAENIIKRAMNPVTPEDFKWAKALQFPESKPQSA